MPRGLPNDPERGDTIRRLREQRYLEVAELAGEVGVNERTLGAWEAGRGPTRKNLRRLADALDVDPGELDRSEARPEPSIEVRVLELEERMAALERAVGRNNRQHVKVNGP